MRKNISYKAKAFLLASTLWAGACTHTPNQQSITTHQIDKPLIQNLTSAHPSMQNLKHSLVRLRIEDEKKQIAFGTGFFFKSRELLVTTLHTFEGHPCLEKKNCSLFIGIVKNENEISESTIDVSIALIDRSQDLLFLSVKNSDQLSQIVPLQKRKQEGSQRLVAAGFYQDSSKLTFSHGQKIKKNNQETVTSIIVGHGFSGAPVVNEQGELVGMVSSYHPLENNKELGIARYVDID
jgi:S1-C subfamily serine protease